MIKSGLAMPSCGHCIKAASSQAPGFFDFFVHTGVGCSNELGDHADANVDSRFYDAMRAAIFAAPAEWNNAAVEAGAIAICWNRYLLR